MKSSHSIKEKKGLFKGSYVIKTYRAIPGWLARFLGPKNCLRIHKSGFSGGMLRCSPVIENLIVLNQDHGLNMIMQHLQGDPTFPLEIDLAAIGTGNATPSDADTALDSPSVTGILKATGELTDIDELTTEWFITNDELPNDTYEEFGLYCGTQLFARSIISPTHTKADNEDTLVEYIITCSNT